MPVLLGLGILFVGVLAFGLTWRFRPWAGLLPAALAGTAALLRQAMPSGHAEEAMGRGIETFVFWVPLVAVALVGWGLGLMARRR